MALIPFNLKLIRSSIKNCRNERNQISIVLARSTRKSGWDDAVD